ncbi:MAG TPA: M24 family metallopeptidase [Paucimonas sp.]|nr:M24 family metallopeptidase [Paucimonas sp.]
MLPALPYSFPASSYAPDVRANHRAVQDLMTALALDVLLVPSHDPFLTAYTPMENSLRYAVSGFDGSAGSGVFVRRELLDPLGCGAQFILFVDGRYHVQAERQTDATLVQVEKLPLGIAIWDGIAAWLGARAAARVRIGWDPYRVSVAQRVKLDAALATAGVEWVALERQELERAVALPGWRVERPIRALPESVTGRSVSANLVRLQQAIAARHGAAATCYVTCAADDICYLLNSRGHHLPNLASHLGYLFVLGREAALYLPSACSACPVELDAELRVFRDDRAGLLAFLAGFDVRQVCYRAESVNCALPQWAREAWPAARHDSAFDAVDAMRAVKTEAELAAVRAAFARSSAAVAQAMRFAKYGQAGMRHSERDLAAAIVGAYREQGAVALSFNPISATGETAALMHYGDASPERELRDGDLVLLDSGAYYAEGFATDCTRTVLRNASGAARPAPWQKEIYTAVLKACLKGMMASYPAGTIGADVDRLVRGCVRERGYDYACGTGHGIGIHVHEGGINFGPASPFLLAPDMVVSVEPGIYLEGRGGVRIENVIVTHPDADAPDRIRFENIIHVGYDWELIDLAALDQDERDYLRDYERACRARGTAVTPCPLLD